MCGIAGWAGSMMVDEAARRRMADAVRHRGPDDEGWFVAAGSVGLGFRRLSIIDLETGNQPLFSEDDSVAVTCNGEIYNFLELRAELEARGHAFRTGTDVEVVAHLYEERGPDCLHALQGMFALAIWDAKRRRLTLARDRLGVKPLYWAAVEGGLVYGSEPGAILASGLAEAAPDAAAIMQYLSVQYVPAPLTGFEGIRKLGPGERLIFEGGSVRLERYWTLPDGRENGVVHEEDVLERLDDLLRDATRGRLIADVPLGAFLSGGVDSSLVVSYMAEAVSRVKTFSIEVPMMGYSEGEHARRVAQIFGTDHHEYVVEPEMVPSLAEAVRHAGEPFADSSAIPTYLISEATRRKVTVALSGDGGDEAFGGYLRYLRAVQLDRLATIARLPARLASSVAPAALTGRFPQVERRLALLGSEPHDRYASMVTHFRPEVLAGLCRPEFIEAAGGTTSAWDDVLRLPSSDPINRYLLLDTTTYLPGDILFKVDRMSMAHALEVRSPLLDYRVHEFAARLPGRYKIRGNSTKWLLKELALRRGIPRETVHRRKMGFGVPIGAWLRGPLRPWLTDLLQSPSARSRGYFHVGQVDRLIDQHLSGDADHEPQLWNLAMLELWHRTMIDGT